MNPVTVVQGQGPVILGQPHAGTFVPEGIFGKLNDLGKDLADTDWHIDSLYDGLLDDATIVRANFHRYVIDANRDPSGASLYPGQNTTALVPEVSFDNAPIWIDASAVHDNIEDRLRYHTLYHEALQGEIRRLQAAHKAIVLYDCHSIRSKLPFLFDGRLPDLNIGDDGGKTCAPALTRAVETVCAEAGTYSFVVNGRFRGGWTVRHYGRPADRVHAIQMEITQRCYLDKEALPFAMNRTKTVALRSTLRSILRACEKTALDGRLTGAGHG